MPSAKPKKKLKKMLFVDDEPRVCKLVSKLGQAQGVEVVIAYDSDSALTRLQSEADFFLILADEKMPGTTGTELLQIVQEKYPTIERALLSGADEAYLIEQGYKKAGIFKFLSKPVREHELRELITDITKPRKIELVDRERFITARMDLFKDAVSEEVPSELQHIYNTFSKYYLASCRVNWGQFGIYNINIAHQEPQRFNEHLKQRCRNAIRKSLDNIASFKKTDLNEEVKLSKILQQFKIPDAQIANRAIQNPRAHLQLFEILRKYAEIIDFDLRDRIKVKHDHIVFIYGSKFTYTDLFNPMLSHMIRGADLVALQVEFFLLIQWLQINTCLVPVNITALRLDI